MAVVAALVVLAAACRVDIAVRIDAQADGSGRVRVEVVADKDVAAAVDLSAGARVEDLKQAGWTVEGPSPRPDGGFRVVATKPFLDGAGARTAVEELSGPNGAFRDFRLERSRSFARTTTRLSGTVDLAKGIEAFGDAGLGQALGGSDVGIDLPRLEQALKGPVGDSVGVKVAVVLPGKIKSNAPGEAASDGARWQVRLSDRVDVSAESSAWNVPNLAGAAFAAIAVLALVALLLRRRIR